MNLNQFINTLKQYFLAKNGEKLSELLKIVELNLKLYTLSKKKKDNNKLPLIILLIDQQKTSLLSTISEPYDQILLQYLYSLYYMHYKQDYIKAYNSILSSSDKLFKLIKSYTNENNWYIWLINNISVQLRISSYYAEEISSSKKNNNKNYINEAQGHLLQYFRLMIIDRQQDVNKSKKLGCLNIVVQLFKIYFKLNNHRLCSTLVRSVENPTFFKI